MTGSQETPWQDSQLSHWPNGRCHDHFRPNLKWYEYESSVSKYESLVSIIGLRNMNRRCQNMNRWFRSSIIRDMNRWRNMNRWFRPSVSKYESSVSTIGINTSWQSCAWHMRGHVTETVRNVWRGATVSTPIWVVRILADTFGLYKIQRTPSGCKRYRIHPDCVNDCNRLGKIAWAIYIMWVRFSAGLASRGCGIYCLKSTKRGHTRRGWCVNQVSSFGAWVYQTSALPERI